MGNDHEATELAKVFADLAEEVTPLPPTREDLAKDGIVGVNPDLAERLLRFGYASSAA